MSIVGIDLGTTNSCICYWKNGTHHIIPDEFGHKTVPSCVSFTNLTKYVGREAKKQQNLNPLNSYYEIKRLLGRKIYDLMVQKEMPYLTYKVCEGNNENVAVKCNLSSRKPSYSPEEISAIILTKLKIMGELSLEHEVKQVVITVPAYFNDAQRQATIDSATIAGLDCIRIINEPTAAALAYGMVNRSKYAEEITVLVYDLGGGTLDCSLLTIADGVFEVLASTGNTRLGGADFDNRLIGHCLDTFKKKHKLSELNISALSLQKLKQLCENAKKMLGHRKKVGIKVEQFYKDLALDIIITLDKFNEICNDLFILCLKPVSDILKTCKIGIEQIDDIILVGGGTRMKTIRENIKRFFKGKELNTSINPDEAVAIGASIQGYILGHKEDPFSESIVLLDVIPLSLGVKVMGNLMNVIIPRNTTIPVSKKQLYTTDKDNQDEVEIEIYEGERKLVKDNYLIGKFIFSGLEKAPKGVAEIAITFSVNSCGIINVTATDNKNEENKKTIQITGNKSNLTEEQIKKLVIESKHMEQVDKQNMEKQQLLFEINDLLNTIVQNLNDDKNILNLEDKQKILQHIENTNDELAKPNANDKYKEIIKAIKSKYATLILKKCNDDILGSANETKMGTSIYASDDAIDNDTGIGACNEQNKNTEELDKVRTELVELCNRIANVSDARELVEETMLWVHVAENMTVIDCKERINKINAFVPKTNNEELLDDLCVNLMEMFEGNDKIMDEIKKTIAWNTNRTNEEIEKVFNELCNKYVKNIWNTNTENDVSGTNLSDLC